MNTYKVLNKQRFQNGKYSLVPIRMEDRYAIMQWRNEQIYHLRQDKPLSEEDQDIYFKTVISKLFNQVRPDQILFSFLENDKCIGYGGLVHINWIDNNAEISFIMDTALEKNYFKWIWNSYIKLIEEVAFNELRLHKIYTFAYDLRPVLYEIFEDNQFKKDAILRDHILFEGKYIHAIIHSKINNYD